MRVEEEDKIRKAKAEKDERNGKFRLEEMRIREDAREHQKEREHELYKE